MRPCGAYDRRVLRAGLAAVAALVVAPAAAAGEGRAVFTDPLTGVPGQHATAVEPDSAAWGNTVVSAFQVGRLVDGGAVAIGWAISTDGAQTWRTGLLPALTPWTTPAGPYDRVSDAAVAYDRVHGVWLVSVLTIDELRNGERESSLVVSRSTDGVIWSAPVTTSPERGTFAHDKNWIACDSWPASPYAGRCYVTWSDETAGSIVAASTSTDGGLSWGPPVRVPEGGEASGTQAVPRPDGSVVVSYLAGDSAIRAITSRDGGATFAAPVTVAAVQKATVPELRAAPLPSADVDRDGRAYVAWHDCRFRRSCGTDDIVIASSPDGARWTPPSRVPLSPLRARGPVDRDAVHHVIPGLAVDPTSSGGGARLALASYAVGAVCSRPLACPITALYASSADGGRTWSDPVRLSEPLPVSAISETSQGRMVGDYVSTSFIGGGVAVPVVSAPLAPLVGSLFTQSILAAALGPRPAAPLRTVSLSFGLSPARPGARLTATLELDRRPLSARALCAARVGGRAIAVLRRAVIDERAECAWRLPRRPGATTVRASIGVRHAGATLRRGFRVPIRRP